MTADRDMLEQAYGDGSVSTADILDRVPQGYRTPWGVGKGLADTWAAAGLGALGNLLSGPYRAAKGIMDRGPVMLSSSEGEGDHIGQQAFDAGSIAMAGAPFMPENAVGSFGGKLPHGRRAEPLPMDEASRMARAKEMGFDTDNPLYVSALQPLDEFKPHGAYMGDKGLSGISLSDKPGMASRYLDRYGDYDYQHQPPFNKNMMKVYIRPGEVREFDKPIYDNVPKGRTIFTPPSGPRPGAPLPPGYQWPNRFEGVDTAVFPDIISATGDVKHFQKGAERGWPTLEGKEYILRDPTRIRAVNAEFDPAKINSANLLAAGSKPEQGALALDAAAQRLQQEPSADMKRYLRIGDWHPSETSRNYAAGKTELGVSVYDLDPKTRKPIAPEGEWADVDMRERLASKDPKYIVTGEEQGTGHDGEPLLKKLKKLGPWEP